MKQDKSKSKKWLWYTIYGILLAVGLLYYMFPSDSFKDYLKATVEGVHPRFLVLIREVSPSFSFGLKFLGPGLSLRANPNMSLFQADRLLIRPLLWSFLRGKGMYSVEGRAYDGDIKGSFHFGRNRGRAPLTSSIEFKDIRLSNHASLSALIGRNVKGVLEGTISYSGQYNLIRGGSGEADLRISDGRVELLKPILSLQSIDFNELRVKMILRNRKINLTRVELKGREIQGTLSGTVSLRTDFLKSNLNIKGSLEPFTVFFESDKANTDTVKFFKQRVKMGRVSFIIQGTLAEPRVRFL